MYKNILWSIEYRRGESEEETSILFHKEEKTVVVVLVISVEVRIEYNNYCYA